MHKTQFFLDFSREICYISGRKKQKNTTTTNYQQSYSLSAAMSSLSNSASLSGTPSPTLGSGTSASEPNTPSQDTNVGTPGLRFAQAGSGYCVIGYTGSAIEITIPATYNGLPVHTIGFSTFLGGSQITKVTLPASIRTIESKAFQYCSSLKSVTIPTNSVITIDDEAFSGCTALTSITIPSSVTSIGHYAFYNCTGLTSVTFENTTGWYLTKDSTATSGTSIAVTDPTTNAANLRGIYANYYWKRNG